MAGWSDPSAVEPGACGFLYFLLPDALTMRGAVSSATVFILVILQSVLIYDLAGRYRLLEPRNWLPSMAYVLTVFSLPEFHYLSAPLLAISFFPLLLGALFGMYKKAFVIGTAFDIGFMLGLSALLYPPVLLFFIPVLLGVRSLRTFSWHERTLLFAGVFTPWFLLWTWAFWTERTAEFWQYNFGAFTLSLGIPIPNDASGWIKLGLWAFFLLVVVLSLSSYYYKKLIQTQKYYSIILWFILTGIALQLLFHTTSYYPLLLMSVSLGILIGHTLSVIRNAVLAEALHWAMLICIFVIQFIPVLKNNSLL